MKEKEKYIYHRKDGRFEGRYIIGRIGGRARYRSIYGHSFEEVRMKLAKAQASSGKSNGSVQRTDRLSKIAEQWLESASPELKKTSIIKYEDLLRCYILPRLGNKKLSGITQEDINDFTCYLRKEGGNKGCGLSRATVSSVLSLLNRIKGYAVEMGYIVRFNPKSVNIKQEKKEIRVLSENDRTKLTERLINEADDPLFLSVLLSMYTGLRIGEICALKWGDIDISAGTLTINKTMQRIRVTEKNKKTEVSIMPPKSECSIRVIPIPKKMVKYLKGSHEKNAYILTDRSESYIEPRRLRYAFAKILDSCGIDRVNFHVLRHSFATRCIECGFDVKCLSEILGHSGVSFTMNRYVHPSLKLKAENMNKVFDW